MTRHRPLHRAYERLIGTAAVDRAFAQGLFCNPRATALSFGISAEDAELVADIRVTTLSAFATTLIPRLYGADPTLTRSPHAATG
jgi:hypothetical protein